jgi:hypothetical protein
MLSTRIRAALTVVAILAVFATARTSAQLWSDLYSTPEVENYELTMEKVRTFMAVQRAIASDPEAASKIDSEFKKLSSDKAKVTIADVAPLLDRQPQVRRVLDKTGTTSRDFLLMSGAFVNAGVHYALRERDGAAPRSAAQQANVALLEKNHVEWKKIEQELVDLANQAESTPKR